MHIETIFCDLVRTENNGKHLLVGVYASNAMFVPYIPGGITISAFSRVTELPAGIHQVEARIYSPHDKDEPANVFTSTINIRYPELPTPVITGPAQLHLQDIGFVTLKVKVSTEQGDVFDVEAGSLFVGKALSEASPR